MVEPLLPRFAHTLVSAVDASIRALRVFDPLDLGVAGLLDEFGQHRQEGVLVYSAAGGDHGFHKLDVLLRHPRPSIPSAGAVGKRPLQCFELGLPLGWCRFAAGVESAVCATASRESGS